MGNFEYFLRKIKYYTMRFRLGKNLKKEQKLEQKQKRKTGEGKRVWQSET
jgi:hypothetical protein